MMHELLHLRMPAVEALLRQVRVSVRFIAVRKVRVTDRLRVKGA
jgi:hypothetical protein